jgi:hypothetical protein
MLEIKKGEPWLFWPSNICKTFPEKPGNKVLVKSENFTIKLSFKLLEQDQNEKTLFTIVPNYTGISIHENRLSFALTSENGVLYEDIHHRISENVDTEIVLINKPEYGTEIYIDGYLRLFMKDNISFCDEPHIIFGAGNFPQNGFNLNYCHCSLNYFELYHNDTLISQHDFVKFIHDKSYDLTGNCNFLNKI